MRLLIDADLSPKVAAALRKVGLESVHVGDAGLLTAPDRGILDYAAANAMAIVSADSDFGELLAAARGATRPSVVLLRSADRVTSDQRAALLAANLPAVADHLEAGRDRHHRGAGCESAHCPSFPSADPTRGARAADSARARSRRSDRPGTRRQRCSA